MTHSNKAIGDTNLKSYSVSYTTAYFHYLTNSRLDLWKVFNEQIIDDKISNTFKDLLSFVYNHLVQEAGQTLISEYAKKRKFLGETKRNRL